MTSHRAAYGDKRPPAWRRRQIRLALFAGRTVAPCWLQVHPDCPGVVALDVPVTSRYYPQLDRVDPGMDGGKYDEENCRLACGKCNRMRQAMPVIEIDGRGVLACWVSS